MKHLKLFEKFDRYEFGEINTSELSEIYSEAKQFTEEDHYELIRLLAKNKKIINIKTSSYKRYDVVVFDYIDNDEIDDNDEIVISIYYLGDYCFAIHYFNSDFGDEGNEFLYLVDTIEGILPAIDLLREKDENT